MHGHDADAAAASSPTRPQAVVCRSDQPTSNLILDFVLIFDFFPVILPRFPGFGAGSASRSSYRSGHCRSHVQARSQSDDGPSDCRF